MISTTTEQYFGSKVLVYEDEAKTKFTGHVSEACLDGRWWVFPAADDVTALEDSFDSPEKAIKKLVEIYGEA